MIKRFVAEALTVCCLSFLSFSLSYAQAQSSQCQSLHCVRVGIDQINAKIVTLLGQRLRYVARAGELKGRKHPVHDPKREAIILQAVMQQAKEQDYPPQIAKAVFKTILQQSVQYEKRFNN